MARRAKTSKDRKVTFRLTQEQFEDIERRIPLNKNGGKMFTVSHFIRESVLRRKVVAVDQEIEEYKVVAASKIGNNINQIAHRLNTDNLQNKVDQETYREVLEQLNIFRDEMLKTLAPLS